MSAPSHPFSGLDRGYRNVSASDLSQGSKVLLGACGVLFIDLFLHWQRFCVGDLCGSRSGWEGIGVLVGLLAIAAIAWEVVVLSGNAPAVAMPAALLSAALGGLVALFAIIEFLSHNEARHWPAWIGLICAIAAGYGAFLRFAEGGGAAALPRDEAPPAA
jgi:hypothetical protein